MSSHPTYVPKHRGAPVEPALKKGVRRGVVLSGIAVASTGVAVSGGLALAGEKPGEIAAAAADLGSSATAQTSADRAIDASRSDLRPAVDATKALVLSQESGGQVTKTEEIASGDPRDIARALLGQYGWDSSQFECLDSLWERESHWNPASHNARTGAHGIPQAMPGSKMASIAPDWQYNPETQIKWGLQYIQGRYGTPCGAWKHSQGSGWY